MDNAARIAAIRQRLEAALNPTTLEINDESHLHVGHEGAKTGLGHFAITIAAPELQNKTRIQQHQSIYAALGSMMQTDIHALRITISKT